jgi:ribosome-associated translation inhibitor RaiA
MKLILQHANLRTTDNLDRWIEDSITRLLPMIRIEEARVRLEYVPEASPAYRAVAHLVIPGPDIKVEAVDHTPQNAFAKVFAQLKAGAIHRAARRLRRHLFGPRMIDRSRTRNQRN